MKSKIGAAALIGALFLILAATTAGAQCTGYPGPMIKFDSNGYAYETAYNPSTLVSSSGSQMVFVGKVSLFCAPFLDLDPTSTTTEYTFVWNGLVSQGTTTTVVVPRTTYATHYLGGSFHLYAGSPQDIPGTLPALPAAGIIPDTYANGTLLLEGTLDDLLVTITKVGTSFSGSFRTNYHCTGGSLFDRVGSATDLLSGVWCPVPPSSSTGTCTLPTGWSAHASGKWDAPATTPASSTAWGKIKMIYR